MTHLDQVIDEVREIRDAVVDIGRLVDANQGLVEDGEEVSEQLKCDGLLNETQHHGLIALSKVQLHQLLEVGKELRALSELLVNVLDRVVERNVGIVEPPDLFRLERRTDELRPQNGNDDVEIFASGFLPDRLLDLLVGVRVHLQLINKYGIANLIGERIDGPLEAFDAVVQCHGEDALH